MFRFIGILLVGLVFGLLEDEDDYFRIIAPQVICDSEETGDDLVNDDSIAIVLQPRSDLNLTYRVKIKIVDFIDEALSQRQTLLVWKSIYELESKINTVDNEKISNENFIAINKTELISGVIYSFDIEGLKANSTVGQHKTYTVKYKDDSFESSFADGTTVLTDATFLLYGPSETYTTLEYRAVGILEFCVPQNNYYYQWTIEDLKTKELIETHSKGTILALPSNRLVESHRYKLTSTVIQAETNMKLISDELTIRIFPPISNYSILPVNLVAGPGRRYPFRIIINRLGKTIGIDLNLKINWKCEKINGSACENPTNSTTKSLWQRFDTVGEYKIIADITDNGKIKTVSCSVSIQTKLVAKPIIQTAIAYIKTNDSLHVDTVIDYLVAGCHAKWTAITEDSYGFIDTTLIPSNSFGNIIVYDLEENFLSELIEFENSTVSKTISMSIPALNTKGETIFQPNTRYKFRLNIICPEPIDIKNPNIVLDKITTTSIDIQITTGNPPNILPLMVSPLNGTAVKQEFKFTGGILTNYTVFRPVRYKFYCIVDSKVISLGDLFEIPIYTTLLPFSENPIQTFYKVCDALDACKQSFGPEIQTSIDDLTNEDLMFFNEQLNTTIILRNDFEVANTLTKLSLLTYSSSSYLQNLNKTFNDAIKHFKEKSTEMNFCETDVYGFAKIVNDNPELVQTNKDINIEMLRILDSCQLNSIENDRNGTSIKVRKLDKDNIYLTLDLTEKVLQSTDNQILKTVKENFLKKLSYLLQQFCEFAPNLIEHKLLSTEVRVITSEGLHQSTLYIPFATFSKSVPIVVTSKPTADSTYCLATAFLKDFFNSTNDDVYGVFLFPTIDQLEYKIYLRREDFSGSQDDQCASWNNKTWNDQGCKLIESRTKDILCQCSDTNFVKLDRNNMNSIDLKSTLQMPSMNGEIKLETTTLTMKTTITDKIIIGNITRTTLPLQSDTSELSTTSIATTIYSDKVTLVNEESTTSEITIGKSQTVIPLTTAMNEIEKSQLTTTKMNSKSNLNPNSTSPTDATVIAVPDVSEEVEVVTETKITELITNSQTNSIIITSDNNLVSTSIRPTTSITLTEEVKTSSLPTRTSPVIVHITTENSKGSIDIQTTDGLTENSFNEATSVTTIDPPDFSSNKEFINPDFTTEVLQSKDSSIPSLTDTYPITAPDLTIELPKDTTILTTVQVPQHLTIALPNPTPITEITSKINPINQEKLPQDHSEITISNSHEPSTEIMTDSTLHNEATNKTIYEDIEKKRLYKSISIAAMVIVLVSFVIMVLILSQLHCMRQNRLPQRMPNNLKPRIQPGNGIIKYPKYVDEYNLKFDDDYHL